MYHSNVLTPGAWWCRGRLLGCGFGKLHVPCGLLAYASEVAGLVTVAAGLSFSWAYVTRVLLCAATVVT